MQEDATIKFDPALISNLFSIFSWESLGRDMQQDAPTKLDFSLVRSERVAQIVGTYLKATGRQTRQPNSIPP